MELLELLATRHKDWMRMVRSFGCPQHITEDIVQEMYLRMYKYIDRTERIMYGDDVNTFFVYVTLRNLYIDYTKAKSRIVTTDAFPEDRYELEPEDREQAIQSLVDEIWDEVKSWHWYDEKLFTIYMQSEMSMRDLSSETKISLRSIFNTIKNGKERIQSNCKESYDSYKEAGERSW
jgi:DNA-directed RNA polymerase specialized sigma24 family protein